MLALFLYSTKRSDDELLLGEKEYQDIDEWFSTDSNRLDSYTARYIMCVLSMVLAFAPLAIAINENANFPKCGMSFAHRMQRFFSTKETTRFSHTHRFIWFSYQLVLCLSLYGFWHELNNDNTKMASVYYEVCVLLQIILPALGSLLFMSRTSLTSRFIFEVSGSMFVLKISFLNAYTYY